jgi:hypothetical protein
VLRGGRRHQAVVVVVAAAVLVGGVVGEVVGCSIRRSMGGCCSCFRLAGATHDVTITFCKGRVGGGGAPTRGSVRVMYRFSRWMMVVVVVMMMGVSNGRPTAMTTAAAVAIVVVPAHAVAAVVVCFVVAGAARTIAPTSIVASLAIQTFAFAEGKSVHGNDVVIDGIRRGYRWYEQSFMAKGKEFESGNKRITMGVWFQWGGCSIERIVTGEYYSYCFIVVMAVRLYAWNTGDNVVDADAAEKDNATQSRTTLACEEYGVVNCCQWRCTADGVKTIV